MGYSDAMALTRGERYLMHIVLGRIHGGEFDYKHRRWTKPPQLGVKLM